MKIQGNRARDAYDKTIVLGLFKREYKAYIEIAPDYQLATVLGISSTIISNTGSVIYSSVNSSVEIDHENISVLIKEKINSSKAIPLSAVESF